MSRSQPKRAFTSFCTPDVQQELARLLNEPPVSQYRDAMTKLGGSLGAVARKRLNERKDFAVVTTPEDADFLTRGLLGALPRERARLACYWTTRHTLPGRTDVATVIQSYVDPAMPKAIDTVVIAKSIIASGCIVRTALETFLLAAKPRRILIVAPVMLDGAERSLREEFPPKIASLFEFISFATDSTKVGDTVEPGVGGQVEERLGLSSRSRRFSPELVNEWRATAKSAAHA